MIKKIKKVLNKNKTESRILFWQSKSHQQPGSIVDMIAIKNNLKPLFVSIAESKEKIESLKKVCKKMNLIFGYKKYKTNLAQKHNQIFSSQSGARYNVYISKDPKLIEQAKKVILQGFTLKKDSYKNFSALLGYPICCVKNFLEGKSAVEELKPYIFNKIPFYNNNLLVGTASNCRLGGYEPCSYTCKNASQLNKKILLAVKKDVPDYYQFLKNCLKRPLLIWINDQRPEFGLLDSLVSIVFEGTLKRGILKYKRIYPHFPVNKTIKLINSPSKKDLGALTEGNKLSIEEKCVKVYKDNLLIYKIKRLEHSAILVNPV